MYLNVQLDVHCTIHNGVTNVRVLLRYILKRLACMSRSLEEAQTDYGNHVLLIARVS